MKSPRATGARESGPVAYCYRERDYPVLWRVGGWRTEAELMDLLDKLRRDPELELLWFEVLGVRVEVNPVPWELRPLE